MSKIDIFQTRVSFLLYTLIRISVRLTRVETQALLNISVNDTEIIQNAISNEHSKENLLVTLISRIESKEADIGFRVKFRFGHSVYT